MVPSALRTLSVVVLLGAVSGASLATAPHSQASSGAVQGAELDLTGRIELTGSTIYSSTGTSGGTALTSATLAGGAVATVPRIGLRTAVQTPALAEIRLAAQVRLAAEKTAAEKTAAQKKAAQKKAAAKKAAAKKKAAAQKRREQARKKASRSTPRSSRAIAKVMVAQRGWKSGQYTCLVKLWNKESGWRHTAANSSSGAYGIPQSLPGSKMATAGKDWRTNPATQIKWGLNYIEDRYGSPCGAWAHSRSTGWY
ncbi:transglycosylase SLT domain-containing protein [Kineosporia sp. J2-2]|uniref:Transglycosylase SLT domain-containing protein n=1 Tax=Kineosporia corallincola TaxID=2835133 RepID=A0ABS5THA5_9ACTN|nr:transglycosylase SLT domain-containing protein [Kineosporia corallincola]MBT0770478.1 transglycosylase SLT domain-containing protein [Kineosporia corallincola]